MIVTGADLITEFIKKRQQAEISLNTWKQLIEKAQFKMPMELKSVFSKADYVKPYTIFDIGGNKFRLIAIVNYGSGVVAVKFVMTHDEYTKGNWRQ